MKLKRSEIHEMMNLDRIIDDLFLYNIEDIEHFKLYFHYNDKPYYIPYISSKGAMIFNVDLNDYEGEDIYEYIDSLFEQCREDPDELVECTEAVEERMSITSKEASLLSEEDEVEDKELFYITTIETEDSERIVFGCGYGLTGRVYSFENNPSANGPISCLSYPFGITDSDSVEEKDAADSSLLKRFFSAVRSVFKSTP